MGGPSGLTRTFVRGEGAELFDESGRAYLDFVAGFGSLNLGHNHPDVVAAVTSALSQQAPGFSPGSVNPLAAALAERLVAITPRGLEIVFFTNSGAESIEAALKLARAATGRSGLLSCQGSFHGKTFGALSVTGNRTYQGPFGPLVPDCQAIPYGDVKALELALATRRHAAFVVEPIQGEGGMVTPPPGYLAEAHRLCREAGTLFIADEVQTGLGRTGPLFAVERDGIEPDILTLAKSLGGGLDAPGGHDRPPRPLDEGVRLVPDLRAPFEHLLGRQPGLRRGPGDAPGPATTARCWPTPPAAAASFATASRRSPAPARSSARSGAMA